MSGWDDLPTDSTLHDLGKGSKYTKVVDSAGVWVGINEWHLNPKTGELCGGWVPFDVDSPSLVHRHQRSSWSVESYEPLTLAPSLLCRACNHHGFIRNGCWEPC